MWDEAEMTVPLEEEEEEEDEFGPLPTTIRLIVHRKVGKQRIADLHSAEFVCFRSQNSIH